MNQSKLTKLTDILDHAKLIVIDGEKTINSCKTYDCEGIEEKPAVTFEWKSKGNAIKITITEQGLNESIVEGNRIRCNDSKGKPVVLELFSTVPLFIPT